MKLKVEYFDGQSITNPEFDLTYLQFIKHLAFAGMEVHTSPYFMFRFLGFMFEFLPYWKTSVNGLELPEIVFRDPTELGQISNRIGKALADFLAKKIYKAKYTHNYEHAMFLRKHPIKGERPDLYCHSLTKQFAIEAKGYKKSRISDVDMEKFKMQSKKGPLTFNFTVASVAYNLYKDIHVKFHDPVGIDMDYSTDLNKELVDTYYRSILNLIKQFGLLPSNQVDNLPQDYVAYKIPLITQETFLYLLLHRLIVEEKWGRLELTNDHYNSDSEDTYIDVDCVGLCIR
ncbi:MAG: hypothetical protein QX191_10790 [Methylococcaceae bacterium]